MFTSVYIDMLKAFEVSYSFRSSIYESNLRNIFPNTKSQTVLMFVP